MSQQAVLDFHSGWPSDSLHLEFGSKAVMVRFLESAVLNDLSLDERSNYVDWLFDTAGKGLFRCVG